MRSRPTETSGQTLPLFALMLPVMLAAMALGLDAAQVFLERREAQMAADLGALSGSRSLPDKPNTAKSDAKAVAAAHGYALSQIVATTPYNGQDTQIEVTVNSSVSTFFMGILGLVGGGDFSSVDVSARAVAEADVVAAASGGGGFAILALEGCGSGERSVDVSGSVNIFTGRIHSNSDVYFGGSTNTVNGATTYGACDGIVQGDNSFNPAPAPGPAEPDPIARVYADYSCDFLAPSTGDWDLASDGVWWVGGSKDSKTLRAGTYCARGNDGFIKLSDSDIVIEDVVSGDGGVTFVSKWKVDISGSDFDLHPHEAGVLVHAEGNEADAAKLAGSGGSFVGLVYAPNGTAELSGSTNANFSGGVVGERVTVNGSDISIDGNVGAGAASDPEVTIGLVE